MNHNCLFEDCYEDGMYKAKRIYYINYNHKCNELLLVYDSNDIRKTTKDELKLIC